MTDIAIHQDWNTTAADLAKVQRLLRRLRAVPRLLRLHRFTRAADIAFARGDTPPCHADEAWLKLYLRSRL